MLTQGDGLIPAFIDLTDGKTHEVNIGRTIKLPKGSILTMDRGYIDYQWFDDLNRQGVFFVTRAKKNMCYRVVSRHQSNRRRGITSDQTIELTSQKGNQYTGALRRVAYKDPDTKKHYYYLTNQMNLAAITGYRGFSVQKGQHLCKVPPFKACRTILLF